MHFFGRYSFRIKSTTSKGIVIDSIAKYLELCDQDIRLPRDPAKVFGNSFNWPTYLGISNKYYTREDRLLVIKKYISASLVTIGMEYSSAHFK